MQGRDLESVNNGFKNVKISLKFSVFFLIIVLCREKIEQNSFLKVELFKYKIKKHLKKYVVV